MSHPLAEQSAGDVLVYFYDKASRGARCTTGHNLIRQSLVNRPLNEVANLIAVEALGQKLHEQDDAYFVISNAKGDGPLRAEGGEDEPVWRDVRDIPATLCVVMSKLLFDRWIPLEKIYNPPQASPAPEPQAATPRPQQPQQAQAQADGSVAGLSPYFSAAVSVTSSASTPAPATSGPYSATLVASAASGTPAQPPATSAQYFLNPSFSPGPALPISYAPSSSISGALSPSPGSATPGGLTIPGNILTPAPGGESPDIKSRAQAKPEPAPKPAPKPRLAKPRPQEPSYQAEQRPGPRTRRVDNRKVKKAVPAGAGAGADGGGGGGGGGKGPGSTAPSSSSHDVLERPASSVYVAHAILDSYSFHGIKNLYGCGVFFLIIFLATWFQTQDGATAFKSSVVNSFQMYDTGNEWEQSRLDGADDISSAYEYITSYMTSIVRRSQEILPEAGSFVYLGDFAHVTYAQLEMQFPNCDQTSALLPAVEQLREARNPGRPPVAYVNPAVSPIIQFGLVPTPRGVDTDNVLSLADKCTTLSSLVLPVASTDRLSTNIYQLLTEDRCYKEERAKDGRPLLTEPQLDYLTFMDLVGRLERRVDDKFCPDAVPMASELKKLPDGLDLPCDEPSITCLDGPGNGAGGGPDGEQLCFCSDRDVATGRGRPVGLEAYINLNDGKEQAVVEMIRLNKDFAKAVHLDQQTAALAYLIGYTRGTVGKYSNKLKLGMHAYDRRNPSSSVVFYLMATRDSSKGHLQTSTLTLTVATSWKGVGRFFMALVIFATAYDLFCTVSAVRLTYLQGRTLVSYLFPRFGITWHLLDACHHCAMLAWIIWWFYLLSKAKVSISYPQSYPDLRQLHGSAQEFTSWLYYGVAMYLLVGLRCFRHMKYHPSLRIFYTLFRLASRDIFEFSAFVLGMVVLLCASVFGIFIISGGNELFTTFSWGISAMARLSFGFLDYDEFVNNGAGLGQYDEAMVVFFWLSVLLLVLIVQNTLLAIFTRAYEAAKAQNSSSDTLFWFYALCDLLFWYYRIRNVLLVLYFALFTDPLGFTSYLDTPEGARGPGARRPYHIWTSKYDEAYGMDDGQRDGSGGCGKGEEQQGQGEGQEEGQGEGQEDGKGHGGGAGGKGDASSMYGTYSHVDVEIGNVSAGGTAGGTAAQRRRFAERYKHMSRRLVLEPHVSGGSWAAQLQLQQQQLQQQQQQRRPELQSVQSGQEGYSGGSLKQGVEGPRLLPWHLRVGRYVWWLRYRMVRYRTEVFLRDFEMLATRVHNIHYKRSSDVFCKGNTRGGFNSLSYTMARFRLASSPHMKAVVRYFTDYDLDRLNILDVAQVEMMHEAALYGRADTIRIGASRRRGSSMRRNGLNAKAADAAVAAAARPHALAAVPESRTATESRTAAAAAAPLGTAFALPAAQEEVILTPGALGIVPSAAALRHSADGSLLGGGGGGAKWKRAAEAVSLGQRQQQQQQSVDGALSSSSDLALVSQPTDSSACVSGETSAGGRRAGPGALPQQGPVPEDDDVVGADDLENAKAVYCMWRAQTSRPARLKINPLAGPLTIGPVQIYRHEPVPRLPPGPRWYDKLRLSALTRQRSGSGTSGGSSCCCCLCPAPLRADDGEVVPEPELRQLDAVALQFFVWASQQDLMWMLLEGPVAIARALKDEELRAWHRLQLYMWQTGPHGEAAAAAERAAREAAGGKAATFSFAAPDPYAEAAAAAAAAAPGVYPLQQVMVEGREEEEEEQQQEQQQQGPGAFAGPDEIQCAGSVPLPAGCQMACLGPRPPPPEEKQQLQSYTQQKSHERLDEKQQKLVQQLQQRVLRKSGGSLAAAQSGTGTTVTPAASVTPAAAAGGTAASPRAARRSFWSRVQRWATICTLWLQWAWLRFRWNPFMAFAHCVDEDDEDLKKLVRAISVIYGGLEAPITLQQMEELAAMQESEKNMRRIVGKLRAGGPSGPAAGGGMSAGGPGGLRGHLSASISTLGGRPLRPKQGAASVGPGAGGGEGMSLAQVAQIAQVVAAQVAERLRDQGVGGKGQGEAGEGKQGPGAV